MYCNCRAAAQSSKFNIQKTSNKTFFNNLMSQHVFTHLTADHAVGESHDVGVGPRALGPRLDVLEVVREVHSVELVVYELPDVPGEVVVAEEDKESATSISGDN